MLLALTFSVYLDCLQTCFCTVASIMYACHLCDFREKSYGRVLSHIEDVHQFEPGFQINCPFCPQTYKIISSFRYVCISVVAKNYCITILRSHLFRKHRSEQQEDCTEEQQDHMQDDVQMSLDDVQMSLDDEVETSREDQNKRRAALFILKLKEERKITQTTLNHLLGDIQCKLGYHAKLLISNTAVSW